MYSFYVGKSNFVSWEYLICLHCVNSILHPKGTETIIYIMVDYAFLKVIQLYLSSETTPSFSKAIFLNDVKNNFRSVSV